MPHPIDEHVGKRIRSTRHVRSMTQQQLADKVGIKFQQIQKYETGMNRVSASRLWDIANALGVTTHSFFPPQGDQGDELVIKTPWQKELHSKTDAMTDDQRSVVMNVVSAIHKTAA